MRTLKLEQSWEKSCVRSYVDRKLQLRKNVLNDYTQSRGEKRLNLLRIKRKFNLIVRLKVIEYYERFLCYLAFLPLPSGLFIYLALFIIRFLFVGLIKVVRHRYSL